MALLLLGCSFEEVSGQVLFISMALEAQVGGLLRYFLHLCVFLHLGKSLAKLFHLALHLFVALKGFELVFKGGFEGFCLC